MSILNRGRSLENLLIVAFLVLITWGMMNLLIRNPRISQFGVESHILYITYKTQRVNALLKRIAERNRFVFQIIGNLGIAFGSGLAVFTAYFLTTNLIRFYSKPSIAVPVTPILPGINIDLKQMPYLLIAIVIAVILHETAHGLVSWSEGIPIKNIGLFLAVLIPGAFVEPDDEKFDKARDLAKLRILSSGSLANLATAIACIVILTNFFLVLSPLYETAPSGVLIVEVTEGDPAERSGLAVGDVIYEVNGERTKTVEQFAMVMSNVYPGGTVEMATSIGRIAIETASREGRSIIGVILSNYHRPRTGLLENRVGRQIPYHFLFLVFWTYTVGLSTAMFNMLPVYPFDGDRFFEVITSRIAKENAPEIRKFYNAIFLGLLGANVMFSITRFGLAVI